MAKSKPWTEAQDNLIREMVKQDFTYSHIAKAVGFSTSHTHRRIIDLGLHPGKYISQRKQRQVARVREALIKGENLYSIAKELGLDVRTVRYNARRLLRTEKDLKEHIHKNKTANPMTKSISRSNREAIETINRVWSNKGLPYRAWWDFTHQKIVSDVPVHGPEFVRKERY